jgi:hypothetical protein
MDKNVRIEYAREHIEKIAKNQTGVTSFGQPGFSSYESCIKEKEFKLSTKNETIAKINEKSWFKKVVDTISHKHN